MSDLTSLLNDLLKKYDTHTNFHPQKRSSVRDEFLKEAYRIVNLLSAPTPMILQSLSLINFPPERPHSLPTNLPPLHPRRLPLHLPTPPAQRPSPSPLPPPPKHPWPTPNLPRQPRPRRHRRLFQTSPARSQRLYPPACRCRNHTAHFPIESLRE